MERRQELGDGFFEDPLHRRCDALVPTIERLAAPARRAERAHELVGVHPTVEEVVVLEEIQSHLERAVRLDADEAPHRLEKLVVRRGERRESHHLPLVGIRLEAEKLRDGAVEQTERVREPHLRQALDVRPPPHGEQRRMPLGAPVQHRDGGLVVRTQKERIADVCVVVIDEGDRRAAASRAGDGDLFGGGGAEQAHEARRNLHEVLCPPAPGRDEPVGRGLEVDPRVPSDGDLVDVAELQARLLEAALDRQHREAATLLLAIEPLLRNRGNDLTVYDDGRGANEHIVANSENFHAVRRGP